MSVIEGVKKLLERQPLTPPPEPSATPSEDDFLFPPFEKTYKTLSAGRQGSHYVLRPLRRDDYQLGFVDLLSQLTDMEGLSQQMFEKRFDSLKNAGNYYTVVVVDGERGHLVAAGTLFIEEKFIHNGGRVGHIEDVVVHNLSRTHKLGRKIVNTLTKIAFTNGCYKVILDCAEKNIGFYQKCGFEEKEVEMVMYKSKL
eukprot:TRINITY_DN9070_c0_g1_i1.p1 TRINITY_DN9070_c0_g1~~TRINITY_DN9070_c0_g1_i1.p1  ORF type:complete len:213 (+),score=66.42 TRINITY_DN9070_c0_g1_i1:48-641(+)